MPTSYVCRSMSLVGPKPGNGVPHWRARVATCRLGIKGMGCLPAAVAAMKALADKAPEESIDMSVCSLLAAFAPRELPDWKAVAGADCVEQVVEALRRTVSRGDFKAMQEWVSLLMTLVGDDAIMRQMVHENCVSVLLLVLATTGLPGNAQTDTQHYLGYPHCVRLQCNICTLLARMVSAGHAEAVLVAGGVEALAGLLTTSQDNSVRENAAAALANLAERDTEERMYMQARGGARVLSEAFLLPDINFFVVNGLCFALLVLAEMPAYKALLQQDAALLAALETRLLGWDAAWGCQFSKTQCRKLVAVCVHRPARRSLRIKRKRGATVGARD